MAQTNNEACEGAAPKRLYGSIHVYEVPPRKDHRGFDLISDALPFGHFWFTGSNAASRAIECAKIRSGSHDFVIRLYDTAGNVIETYEHKGDFKEP